MACRMVVFQRVARMRGSPGMAISASVVSNAEQLQSAASRQPAGGRTPLTPAITRISGATQYKAGSIYATLNTNKRRGGSAILAYQIMPTSNDNGDAIAPGHFSMLPD